MPRRPLPPRGSRLPRGRGTRLAALLLAAATVLAACSGGDDDDSAEGTTASVDPGAATGSVVAGEPAATTTYDLGPVQVDTAAGPLTVELQGVLSVPAGPGPFPVAVVLHGSEPGCVVATDPSGTASYPCPAGATDIRNDEGVQYLLEGLAAAGFVALAPDLDGAYTTAVTDASPGDRTIRIVDEHLTRLATAGGGTDPGFGVPLGGRVDATHLVVAGEGRGGRDAVRMAKERAAAGDTTDGRGSIDALLLVAPTVALPDDANAMPAVPLAVVLPRCDGVVPGLDGAEYYDGTRDAGALAAAVVLEGATHDGFSTTIEYDDLNVLVPGCEAGAAGLLGPAGQQAWLSSYAGAFLSAAVGTTEWPTGLGLRVDEPEPTTVLGAPAITSLSVPAAQRLVVQDPTDLDGATITTLGTPATLEGSGDALFCRAGEPCDPVLTQPSYPPGLLVSWDAADATYSMGIPADRAAEAGAAAAVSLRVAVDPTDARNPTGQPQQMVVTLVDQSGATAQVTVPATSPALGFPPVTRHDGPAEDLPDYLDGVVPYGSVRLPLSGFTGIDTGALAAVEVSFPTPAGRVLLADVEFVR